MGFIKQSITLCIVLVLFSCLKTVLETKLPVVVDGYHHPAFKRVADKFRENVESGKERGAAIAVYHKGEPVVDLWGGYADVESERPWRKDTMTMGFSSTKGVAAIVVATMVEKGYLDYKRPVADYWPAFAQNDKGNITVEILLSHQAGLPILDKPISFEDIKNNQQKVEDTLAAQRTKWPAGTAHGYHTMTYGPYVDTLIRKVDPKGRDTAQIFYEDIAKPFDIDMYMNTPRDQYYRVARLYEESQLSVLLKAITVPRYFTLIKNVMFEPDSIFAESAAAVKEYKGEVMHNNPYLRELTLSCCYSTGTARGYAKLYSILGNDGVIGKQRLLSAQGIRKLATPLASGPDMSIIVNTTFGPGTAFRENPRGEPMFGHTGHGGQVAMVDLKHHLGIGYLTNFPSIYGFGDDPRYLNLEEEIYQCLDDYIKQRS